jgi:Flp pilus assembly protein protease CpaA
MPYKPDEKEWTDFFPERETHYPDRALQQSNKRPVARLAFITSILGLFANLLAFAVADYGALSTHFSTLLKWVPEGLRVSISTRWLNMSANLWQLYLVFFVLMLAITWHEWKEEIIPDAITIPGLLIGLGMSLGYGRSHIGIVSSLGGAAIGYFVFDLLNRIYHRIRGIEGVGGGVLKMAAMIGAFIGTRNIIITIWVTSVIISLYGGYIRLYSRRTDITRWRDIKTEMGPWLALIASICIIFPIRRWLYGS